MFSTLGLNYSQVYVDNSTITLLSVWLAKRFLSTSYYSNPSLTIDDLYVDGVSITYGSAPRRHIWTYVNGLNLVYCTELRMNCPWELN